jgi:hypothetical protein
MAWNSNLRKGTDIPTWDWLSFFPNGNSNPGTAHAYDGARFIYWVVQTGSTTATGTATLWKYDTWTDAWVFLSALTSGFNGIELKYDSVRNVLLIISGNSTEWRVFNLNTTNVLMLGQTITPYTVTTITTVMPTTPGLGSAFAFCNSDAFTDPSIPGVIKATSTSTVLNIDASQNIAQGHAGMRVRMTSGATSGQSRIITSVNALGTVVTLTSALSTAPAINDTFVVEYAQGTATGTQTTLILQDTTQTWTTNFYANMDAVILSGTGSGQRKRIASNTADTLTLAAAVTGNPRTGAWATAPDATSVYKIVPSSDFLYYQAASNGTAFYKIDLNTGTTSTTWTALTNLPAAASGGGDLVYTKSYAPYVVFSLRGNGTNSIYQYNIGLNTWTTLPATFMGADTFTTGAAISSVDSAGRLLIHKEVQNRIIAYRISDGYVEGVGTLPYAAPSGFDGHRLCKVTTPDGTDWLYYLRAGGAEHYRLALEWF